MKMLLEYALLALLFFLPWQTVWIFREGRIGAPGTSLEGLWQYGTFSIYGWDIIAFFCIVLFFILALVRRGSNAFSLDQKNKRTVLLAGLGVLAAAVTIAWSQERIVAFYYTIRLIEGFLLFTIAQLLKVSWRKIAITFVAAGSIQGLLALTQFFSQDIPASTLFGISGHSALQLGDFVIEYADMRWLRAYGSFPHPNIAAFYLAACLLFAHYAVSFTGSKRAIYLQIVVANVILAGLFFTFSREVWLGLLVSIAVSALCSRVLRRKNSESSTKESSNGEGISPGKVLAISHIVTLCVLGAVYHELVAVRLGIGGMERLEQKSVSERIIGVREGLSTVQEQWYGVGIGQYTWQMAHKDSEANTRQPWYAYQPIHNMHLLIAAEVGAFGFLFFMLFLARVTRDLFFHKPFSEISVLQQRLFLFTLFVGFFDHFFWTVPTGILMWWYVMGICSRLGKNSPQKTLDS